MAQRTAEQIQREIEQARNALGTAVDQLAERTNPKRVADNVKQSLREKARTTQGKAVIAGVGALFAIAVIRKIAKH